MPISTLSLSNTFFNWLLTTNSVVGELNKIESGDYFKTSNTVYITSSGIGLSVTNSASFGSITADSLNVSANATFANLSINAVTANSGIFTNISSIGNTVSLSISTPRRNTSIIVNRGESANSANADAALRWNEFSRHWEIRDIFSPNNYFRLPSSNTTRFGIGTPNPSTSLHIVANDAIILPSGTTAQRPSAVNGMIRYNSNNNLIEAYANNQWGSVGGSSITNDTTSNTTLYLGLSQGSTGTWLTAYVSDTKLTFNPSTGTLFSSNVKTSGLYDSSNRKLVIKDANGVIVWGN